ncbi:MAG: hypothetical protein RLO52_20595 [Sandaracinaceae bacterium]|nr:MAG: hypothetical protein EVA89_19425 [Sandaracinaceae bacterium]
MSQTATTTTRTPDTHARPPHVDELAAMTVAELHERYVNASVPDTLDALDGAPRGRMLTVIPPFEQHREALAAFARADGFPWRGKSFRSFDGQTGDGINRVTLLGDQFPFHLRFGRSEIDGERAILLDYDRPENPWLIRQIHDELRQVGPELFLGPAMWKARPSPKLVLWFAIDTSA